ncbi:putative RNA-directed DNA polymerase [Helianthus annuus]|nr:putative RNA-directed DNA polymerase [Helianthus annuus]
MLSRGCASSFITLIPKVRDASSLNEFRTISLVGVINKVISKVLANRLKKVLPSIISENQSAFVKGKFILDGPLIINETINWIRKSKKKAFLLKVDFEKAYDNVNWGFVRMAMVQMGFPPLWCDWVHGILSSARAAVLVNGSPTFDFQCYKGMRQGDPLSPFLFLIVMEILSCCLEKAVEIGAVSGVRLPNNGPVLSHLLYADDALIMGDWSEESIVNVVRILRGFHICSGLKINLAKSNIFGIGVSESELDLVASRIGCNTGYFPIKYLGITVGANMNRIANRSPVVENFESRLSLWKSSVLSIGGRITLIKSVLECLPNYFFSLYKAPVGVVNHLESIVRRFLWGGTGSDRKMSWVSWDRVASPVNQGGLGLRKLGTINMSLILKWAWRFKADKNNLWVKVISAVHDNRRDWGFLPHKRSLGGVWGNIVKVVSNPLQGQNQFLHFMRGIVGNGRDIAFWLDLWVTKDPLRQCFPNLFQLELDKKCCVRDRIVRPVSNPEASWKWKKPPCSNEELAEWLALCSLLRDISLSGELDKWWWDGEESGEFSIKSAKCLLDPECDTSDRFIWDWCSWLPLKCNVFAWRAEMERLPTRLELAKRNIQVADISCPLCATGDETAAHLFTACCFAAEVWSKVSRWCKVPYLVAFSFKDIIQAHLHCGLKGKEQLMYQGIVIVTCWLIWKARNELVFSGKPPKAEDVFCSIKSVSYLWFKYRSKCIDISWERWCKFA